MTGTSDLALIQFLADPDNVNAFIGTAVTMSLGYGLTEDGRWAKLET
jgi:hypothetical protein